jgi:hypothetical protein
MFVLAKLIHNAKNLFFLVILYELLVFYLLLMQVYYFRYRFCHVGTNFFSITAKSAFNWIMYKIVHLISGTIMN